MSDVTGLDSLSTNNQTEELCCLLKSLCLWSSRWFVFSEVRAKVDTPQVQMNCGPLGEASSLK